MLTLITVPLKQLVASPLNVRKTDPDEDIDGLAASIRARGLKQNLVAVEGERRNTYEVVAGERRRRALLKLAADGHLRPDAPIPVLIEQRADGRETSLDENIQRVAMNPADEVTAFATIVAEHGEQDDPVRYCAQRFGVPRRHVEQRLRLAELAPEILDALRERKIDLGAAKAYGSFADHALQLAVFAAEDRRGYGTKHAPAAIRDAMKSKTYPATIAQAVYVGLDAYVAAGGQVERELFMGADEGDRLTDPALLDRLAREKMATEVLAIAKAAGLAGGLLTGGFSRWSQWPRPPAGYECAWSQDRDDMPKRDRARAIGVYALAGDGAHLELVGFYKPSAAAAANGAGAPPAGSPARLGSPIDVPGASERASVEAQRRAQAIALRAARLAAAPSFAGTPFEGRAFWPSPDEWLLPVTDAGGERFVAVMLRVTDEEIEAHHAEAEAEIDAELAAEEERRSAADVVAAPVGETAHA